MNAKKIRMGVLETGRPPEALPEYDDYPTMVAHWLNMESAEVKAYAVLDMEFPDSPDDADFWVITGSRHGAYEDHPWIKPLEAFIRACRDAGRPMVGICFGHQIIAQALGGVVRKSAKGWGLGVHEYEVEAWPEQLGTKPAKVALQALHQDQVEERPAGAERVASSPFCENAALWYPGFAITFQGHPEFLQGYMDSLLKLRRGTVFTDTEVEAAMTTVGNPTTRDALAGHVKEWIESRLAGDSK